MENINSVKEEYDEIINQLSDPELISDTEKLEELSRKKKKLEEIIEKKEELEKLQKLLEENKEIMKTEQEMELILLAENENKELRGKISQLEKKLSNLLKNDSFSLNSPSAIIIEIRAGTGGDEAALFAADLCRMYLKYAESQNWKYKILDSSPTELGGFKEVIIEIKDKNAYSKIKYEAGVHRVQRIPKTEKTGRVHTSTVSVAVLPKPKATEIKIRPQDLKIDIAKASGPGGQNVNKRMTAVRITHLPTGITVKSMAERTLPQNKENALTILSARLMEMKEKEERLKIGDKRKSQIGKAKRAEKIRTYNFPQNRITDHRIKKTWRGIEEIMNGKLDKIFEAMEKN